LGRVFLHDVAIEIRDRGPIDQRKWKLVCQLNIDVPI